VVTCQLQIKRRTGKVRRPKTDVLPLCHTTNLVAEVLFVGVCVKFSFALLAELLI